MNTVKNFLAISLLCSGAVLADTYPAVYYYYGLIYDSAGGEKYTLAFPTAEGACESYSAYYGHPLRLGDNFCGQMRIHGVSSWAGLPMCQTYAKDLLHPQCYWHDANQINGALTCPGGGTLYGSNCIDAPECISPQIRNDATGVCELPSKSNGPSKGCGVDLGNPVNSATGNKWQHETDLADGASGLIFDRYYNASLTANNGNLGSGWSHGYSRTITVPGAWVMVRRQDGKAYNFSQSSGDRLADADVNDRLDELKDSDGIRIGWRYTTGAHAVESYDAAGRLTSIFDRSGYAQTLTYSDASTPTSIAPTAGLLIRVTDSFGRQLNFTYDINKRISTLTDPAGGEYRYDYDANNNLASVTYPDDTPADLTDNPKKIYLYGEPDQTGNVTQPHALTGIIDENNKRYATFTYDALGRAISSAHAGGAERVSLVYNANGSTTVTDALNTSRNINFQTLLGVVKITGSDQPGGSGCAASAISIGYDANGNVAYRTDFNGNRTNYVHDLARNLEVSRTEGLTADGESTPETRTITTEWHSTFRLPVKIIEPGLEATYSYDDKGNVTHRRLKDVSTQRTREWHTTYTYSADGILQSKAEDGPRTEVSDVTTYDYYLEDAACAGGHFGCRGQLRRVTDSLGHVTQISRYNAYSQPEELVDPNGLVTTLSYDARQRLRSLDIGGETTTYSYDPVGQVNRVTGPDGAYLDYTYDDAHRLTGIKDQLGNAVTYTLDAMGNRIKEDVRDPGGQLARTQSRVYDALSRLQNLVLPE